MWGSRAGTRSADAEPTERQLRARRYLLAFPPAPAPINPGAALSAADYTSPTGAPAGEAAPSLVAPAPVIASAYAVPVVAATCVAFLMHWLMHGTLHAYQPCMPGLLVCLTQYYVLPSPGLRPTRRACQPRHTQSPRPRRRQWPLQPPTLHPCPRRRLRLSLLRHHLLRPRPHRLPLRPL